MINYTLITKPGIIMGNLVTVAAGFLLASHGAFDLKLFLVTLLGLGFVMASACVFNNFIDRKIDRKMERTKNRVLARGAISSRKAILYAIALGLVGIAILFFYTNLLALAVAFIGFFVYVILYSLWKCKTVYGTAIGSIAGAVPPVVGYCAVTNCFDAGAAILFAMLVLWQMPHFFSIAIYRLDDYTRAQIPVLPVKKGMMRTKLHMVVYIIAFLGTTALLTLFHYTGWLYLAVALTLSLGWLFLSLRGFKASSNQLWARKMFICSLVVIMGISLAIPFNTL